MLDDSGNSVSDSGEYYFEVDDMQQGIVYTKKIQIMNMRDDVTYKVFFRAEHISSIGSIDLANECECVITVDGKEIYRGKVTGEGTPDIRSTPLNLGVYNSGQSRHMTVSIVWNGSSAGGFIDNGKKVVTSSGTEIVSEKSGDNISGETKFKWIFYAEAVSSGDVILTGEKIATVMITIIMLASLFMIILLIGKKKKRNT